MAQHTPGPWTVLPKFRGSVDSYRVDCLAIASAAQPIARVHIGIGASYGNEEANATLIAAAPELLEALRAILPYAHSRAEDMLDEGGEDDPLWLKADAAIGAVHDLLARIDSA